MASTETERVFHTALLALHLIATLLFFNNLPRLETAKSAEARFIYKTWCRFYTHWGFTSQVVYIVTMVVSHVLGLKSKLSEYSDRLRRIADLIFTTVALPNALVITQIFWFLYTIDRNLVFPSDLDEYIPWWVNHSFHTFNSVLVVVDMLLTKHKFPSWSVFARNITIFSLSYCLVIVDTRYRYGRHMYTIFNIASPFEVFCCAFAATVASFAIYGAAKYISIWRWGAEITYEVPEKYRKVK